MQLRLLSAIAALVLSIQANAFQSRLEIDPAVDLAALSASGQPVVKPTLRDGDALFSEASAVIPAAAEKVLAVASDFDRYDDMHMPYVEDSRVVERQGQTFYVWTSMSMTGQSSIHYLDVRLLSGLNPRGAAATLWEMTPRRPSWPYSSEPGFTRIEGSFFVQALQTAAGEPPRTYVRYFLSASPDAGIIPDFLVDIVAKGRFRTGMANVIRIVSREALARP